MSNKSGPFQLDYDFWFNLSQRAKVKFDYLSESSEFNAGDRHLIFQSIEDEIKIFDAWLLKASKTLSRGEKDAFLARSRRLKDLLKHFSCNRFYLALPFNVGDTIFLVAKNQDNSHFVLETVVMAIEFLHDGVQPNVFFRVYIGDGKEGKVSLSDFGTAFFSIQEDCINRCNQLDGFLDPNVEEQVREDC